MSVFGLLFLTGSLAFGVFLWYSHRAGEAARNWPTARGVVTASGTRPAGDSGYVPDVRFEYHVGERRFEGDRLSLAMSITSESVAAQSAARYQPGASVTVYYNPRRPEEAVVAPGGFSGQDQAMMAATVVALAALGAWILWNGLAAQSPADTFESWPWAFGAAFAMFVVVWQGWLFAARSQR